MSSLSTTSSISNTASIITQYVDEERIEKNIINEALGIESRIKEDIGYVIIENKKKRYIVFVSNMPSNIMRVMDVYYYKNKSKVKEMKDVLKKIEIRRVYNVEEIGDNNIENNDMIYDIVNKIVIIPIETDNKDIKSIKLEIEDKNIMKFRKNTKIRYNVKDSKIDDINLRSEISDIEIMDYNMILGETIYYRYEHINKYNLSKLEEIDQHNIMGMPVYDVEDKFIGLIYDETRIIPSNIIMNNINKINKKNKNMNIKMKEEIRDKKIRYGNVEVKIKTILWFGVEKLEGIEGIEGIERCRIGEIGNIEKIKYIDDENVEINEELFNIMERNKE